MEKKVEKASPSEIAGILFLTFGVLFYSSPAAVFAADDSVASSLAQAGKQLELKKAVTLDKEAAATLNAPKEKTGSNDKSMSDKMQEKMTELKEMNSEDGSSSEESSTENETPDAGQPVEKTADGGPQPAETVGELNNPGEVLNAADDPDDAPADLAAGSEQAAGTESQAETQKSETGSNSPAPPPPVAPPPVETGEAMVPIEGPTASEPAEATASDLYLDALTQPAAQEAQNDQALNQLFSETSSDSNPGGNEEQAGGNESEAGAAAGVSDQAANPQANMAKRAAAISQTIGEFSTLSARPAGAAGPNAAGSAPGSIHASEQQNFVAAMNVMGNDRQFFSQMMGVAPGQNAPAQMEQMVANMQTGFTQMAEKMATFFAPGLRPGEQGTPGSPMMVPNGAPAGPNNPAGPMMGMGGPMPSGMMPGPNAGLAGPEGMPAGPMPIGMFSMNQMANVMGTAMMAVAMGAPRDQVMGSVENAMQAMHSQAEAYFASNFGTNPNNPEGMMGPNAGPRPEGTGPMPPGMGPYNPAGPMPAGMEGGNFMPGPGGMPFMAGAGFMLGPEGAAFMAPGPGGMSFMPGGMPGAGPNPVADGFQGLPGFSGPGPGGFDPAFTPVMGPPPGVTDNIIQQFQQQMVQQIVQSDPRAAATLQALKDANVTVADINNAGGQIVRTNITYVDPVSGNTDHIHGPGAGNGVVFTVGNEGQPHVDANTTVIHDHTTDQTSPASPHIPLINS